MTDPTQQNQAEVESVVNQMIAVAHNNLIGQVMTKYAEKVAAEVVELSNSAEVEEKLTEALTQMLTYADMVIRAVPKAVDATFNQRVVPVRTNIVKP